MQKIFNSTPLAFLVAFLLLSVGCFELQAASNKIQTKSLTDQDLSRSDENKAKAYDKLFENDDLKDDPKGVKEFSNFLKEGLESKSAFEIKGNQRVDEQTILSYLNYEEFRKNPKQAIADSSRILMESGLFTSVLISALNSEKEDAKLVAKSNQFPAGRFLIEVVESPIILEVKFVGNKKINDEALQSEINLKKRSILSSQKLQADLKRIREVYTKTGRFLTKVEPKIIEKEQNRVELIFDIWEGPKAKIGKIFFLGNRNFNDEELRQEISIRESRWWKFLSSADSYDSDRIEFDKEMLRRFYGNRGFADFAVVSAIAQINREKDRFFVSFVLEEGLKYKIGTIEIENHIEKLNAENLYKAILIKSGKLYNAELIEKSVDAMVEKLSDQAYAFANVEPVLKRDQDKRIIDLEFVIRETPRVYLNQINISGNIRTKDEVIRREIRLREGDPFNIAKINRSKQRIENLGFFEKVEFNTKRVSGDKIDLEIEVKEKKTGELNLGVGYSTVSKFNVNAGIRENNLFGTGRSLGINAQKAFEYTSVDLSYNKPYLLDMPLDGGFDVFQTNQLSRNGLPYNSKRAGFTLSASYSVTEFLSHSFSYNYVGNDISNASITTSILTQNLLGRYLTSGVGQSLLYDKRDNRLNPRDGYFAMFSQNINGLGGDIKTIKHETSLGFYQPIFSREFVAKLAFKGGVIEGIGQDLRSNFGFFADGNNFRGFAYGGIGPRARINEVSSRNGEIIGGKIFYIATAEMRFPLGLPKELGIYGILFSDNGVIKGVDKGITGGSMIDNSGRIRSTAGFSLAWSSPMGPIRLDFAKVLRSELYDVPLNFNFSVGSSF